MLLLLLGSTITSIWYLLSWIKLFQPL